MNDDLLVKHLLGEADERERLRVEQWINADQRNKRHYEQLRMVWAESLKLAPNSQADERAAWERFRERIKSTPAEASAEESSEKISSEDIPPGEAPEGSPPIPVIKPYRRWLRIAAGIALLFTLGWIARFLLVEMRSGSMVELASKEQVLEATLPDGSLVTLNKHTLLTYPKAFRGESRSVNLQGEAFFNVQPDKNKPFIIRVNDVTVKVTGTSFNVKSRDGTTEVIVETGAVQVSKELQEVALNPGDKAMTSRETSSLVKESARNELYKYYRTKEFVCEGTPLHELAEVLSEAYGVQILIPDKELEQLPITTVFKNESLDHILTVISQTFDIAVQHEENRIILKR